MKKTLKIFNYIIFFAFIGSIITVVSLTVVDNYIYSLSQTSAVASSVSDSNEKNTIKSQKSISIDSEAKYLQFSYNNKYYAFLKDKCVHINTLKDGAEYSVIEEDEEICYFNLLYDKNLIIYITAEPRENNVTRLVINTYDIESKRKVVYNKFNITNFSQVKDMNMSPIINIIYINIETKSMTYTNNTIYKIDLFNSMYQVRSGRIYDKMIMLQTKDNVYYEDINSNIYYSAGQVNLFKNKVELIGIDSDDNVYFIQKDTKSIVYKVKNGKIIDTIRLSDSDVVTTYTNNVGTYIVYPTYVINVAASNPYKRIARLTNYVEFLAIKSNTMYLKTKDNKLISTSILEDDDSNEENEKITNVIEDDEITTTTNTKSTVNSTSKNNNTTNESISTKTNKDKKENLDSNKNKTNNSTSKDTNSLENPS